jgi:hypothetical protein
MNKYLTVPLHGSPNTVFVADTEHDDLYKQEVETMDSLVDDLHVPFVNEPQDPEYAP